MSKAVSRKGADARRGREYKLCGLLRWLVAALLLAGLSASFIVSAQTTPTANAPPNPSQSPTLSRYLDQTNGTTADSAVAYALAHNGGLEAARKEIDAARAMVKQARLRANPKLDIDGTRQINGKDNILGANAMLPLELGGRRPARIAVAEREVQVREREVANRERLLAAEVRAKFGEALALALKLSFTGELVEANQQSFNLIAARVVEGATPPLEQNMALVELNRLRSMRESAEGKLEVTMFELRNLIGMINCRRLPMRLSVHCASGPTCRLFVRLRVSLLRASSRRARKAGWMRAFRLATSA